MATAEQVKRLREMTSAGIMDCKSALKEAEGDVDEAVKILRKRGMELATKKAGRSASEGCVGTYIHHGGQIGVMVEINCETDFVARNEAFQEFIRDIAMQIAAAMPVYVAREDVPETVLADEQDVIRGEMAGALEGKPSHVVDQILAGKLDKFFERACLLDQPFIKDTDVTIRDHLTAVIAKLGENVVIRRFVRFELGEDTD